MGRHAKSYNVLLDAIAVLVTLLLAYLRVVRNVSTGRHAWRPLPEIGATPEWGDEMHGWNADPPTVRFGPVWPVVDPDPSPRLSAEDTAAIALDVFWERTADANTWYQDTEVDA